MPNNMPIGYVILESAPLEVPEAKIITDNGKRVIGEGIIQTAEEENRNGRCYLHSDLLREINCARTIELLSTGNMLSENGHPLDSNMVRQQTIDPNNTVARFLKIWMDGNNVMAQFKGTNNTVARFLKIWMDGNNVMAQFKGTNNDKGEEFDQDLREGVLPSWSLRALGSLTNKGGRNIVENLRVVTWDRVIYPSHPHAYTTRLVTESASLSIAEKAAIDRLNHMNENGALIPITNEAVLSYIKNESASIKSLLNQIDFMYESTTLLPGNKVQLVAKTGDIFVINLESHIANEIQAYCLKHKK